MLWQYRLWSFQGIQNKKGFGLKINMPKGSYQVLRIGVVVSCQKLGIILENELIKKLILSKNVNKKKCGPKFALINEKRHKDSDNF